MKLLCNQPQIVLIEDFLSPDECQGLITLAKPKLSQSTVVDPKSGHREEHYARTSLGTSFSLAENELIKNIEKKIENLTNWPMKKAEGLQVLNYQIGGEYRRHFDYFDPELPGSHIHLAQKGQRFATVLMYLNTPLAGGETEFPRLGFSVIAKAGSALFFSNVTHDLTIDPCSEHASLPVKIGEKWVATKWLRERE